MLNPALARVLLTKATPQNTGMLAALLRTQLASMSLISTAQQQDSKKPVPVADRSALLHSGKCVGFGLPATELISTGAGDFQRVALDRETLNDAI